MTEDTMALSELLAKSGDGDFLRTVAEAVLQILMEADVESLIGASRHERSAERLNYRNGYRDRTLDIRAFGAEMARAAVIAGAVVVRRRTRRADGADRTWRGRTSAA